MMKDVPPDGEATRRTTEIGQIVSTCAVPGTAWADILRLMLHASFDGTECPGLPEGPKLFVTNHQIAIDLVYLSSWLLSVRSERSIALAWDGLTAGQVGQMLDQVLAHPALMQSPAAKWLRPQLIDTRDPLALLSVFRKLEHEAPQSNVLVATEGLRQHHDGALVTRVGMSFIDAAVARGLPVVPVRFAWALPETSHRHRFVWPYRMAPMRLLIGPALMPDSLSAQNLPERRDLVAGALNRVYRPAPPGHRDRNAAMAGRISRIMAQTGVNQTKAILIDLLVTADPASLSDEGRALRQLLVDPSAWRAATSDWLSRFALYVSDGGVTLYPCMRDIYGEVYGPARTEAWR